MIKVLTGKYQKHVAWFLFFIFYGELAASLYASERRSNNYIWNIDYNRHKQGLYFINQYPAAPLHTIVHEDVQKNYQPAIENIERPAVNEKEDEDKADIGGPGQPEMNTFKSIGNDNMVNLFTGDFSYNIPLLDVGGYPVNIFYNAGVTMDQEASWVGLGWNINPGTITRNMRGLPDDYNGQDSITKIQSIKPDRTIGVSGTTGMEVVGVPGLGLNIKAGIFYNNRRGLGLEAGGGFDYSPQKMLAQKACEEKTLKDTLQTLSAVSAGVSAGINLNSQNGMSLTGGFSIYRFNKEKYTQIGLSTSVDYSSKQGLTDLKIDGEFNRYKIGLDKWNYYTLGGTGSSSVNISNISFARSSFIPSIRMPLTRFNQFYSVKLGKEKKVFFKNGTIGGYIHESKIDEEDKIQQKPAYGYMYYEKAGEDKNALLDFNRLNDGVYTYKKPVIDLPVYTYDVFNISGEGTGGSFRGYRGNMGYMRDHDTRTKSGNFSLSFDVGGGDIFHGGVILGGVYSPSFVNEWRFGNALRRTAKFKETDGLYQTFYFRNPGEKAIIDEDYYNKMGADQLIRPYLGNTKTATPYLKSGFQVFDDDKKVDGTIPINAINSYRQKRDKRTQVITYFTAEDAAKVGLDTYIYSYTENLFKPGSCKNDPSIITPISRYNEKDPRFYRKAHHISEVDVLESDGRRYIYGIPVYQIKQEEVTFSVQPGQGNSQTQQVEYNQADDPNQNSTDNKSGRDGFFQREIMNGYAHSFLLTGILSPDYVDVTGDGITDDDLGTAVRFNYSRVDKKKYFPFNANYWTNYKWRMPASSDLNIANFNEGLKADSRDDKGLYTYGEKELWYMHSIESKNMVATFYVSSRNDGNQAAGENGGIASGPGQKKLDKINLYTKADYLKYGGNAKPVKTVHFQYSYKLCANFSLNTNSQDGGGKLTLEAIWFSYNGNNTQVKNKYVFKYAKAENNNNINTNPAYNSVETDRWGNYKPHLDNPNDAGNNDFPYTLQNATSNAYAAAWNLERILLPGGGVVKVQYEADDYAFVQDKRASQMTVIAGFGKTQNSTPSNKLYTWNALDAVTPALMDHRFVFFDVTQPVQNKTDIATKYLQGFKQLLLKLWVKMPAGNIGNSAAYEPVIIYGAIKDYGTTANPNRFYVELEETRKGGSPVMETIMQFLKDQLPHRAYPGYEVNGDGALIQVVRSVFGLMTAYTQGVMGFEKDLKLLGKCKEVQLNMSFARLNNPDFKKIGGGHRVKQITISDNWNKMTEKNPGDGLHESTYGQVYDYTTTETINGEKIIISSGVASYEPGVGNEENPFREILKYFEKQFLGPTDYSNVELPIAETFFPSPMVGYSKVTVKSIHNKDNKKIKSGIGLQQTEFYTTRDFPVISDFTDFDNDSRHHHKPGAIEKIFNFNKKDYMTLTQGFRVVLNDMNGKLKSQTSYAENDYVTPVNYTANYYRIVPRGDNKYKLDNMLPVISGPDGKISDKLVGKDVEVMNDFREHFSYTYSANIPLNAEFFTVGMFPVLLPTIFRMAFRDESLYRSATTLKIVNEYGILDSVVNIDKGSVVGTKNMVYDAETGDALVSRTNNEFNKPVYQFSYPAWWVNSGMEPAYRNIDLVHKGILFRNGRIEAWPTGFSIDNFESGDEIFVDHENEGPSESEGCIAGGYPSKLPASSEYRIWALDIRKDLRNTEKEFLFIDRYGNPYNAKDATIRIIRSGKRNLTGASVGNIVSLKNPVRIITNQQQVDEQWVVIDNNTDIINAASAEFKERWRANDMFYAEETTVTTVRLAPVKSLNAYALSSYSLAKFNDGKKKDGHNDEFIHFYGSGLDHFIARRYDKGNRGWPWNSTRGRNDHKSWLKFDFQNLSQNDVIVSAKLNLFSHIKYPSPHDFIYVDGHGTHYDGSHTANNPHYAPNGNNNNFLIDRMMGTWPADNNTVWLQRFSILSLGGRWVAGTAAPLFGDSRKNYAYNDAIDITSLAKAMLRDKLNPALQYETALRLSLADLGTPDSRICFSDRPISKWQGPHISIKYYNCNDAYGLEGNPATPPPGQETAECVTTETGKFCFSVFSKKQMNPYIEGVLGNWRGWKSYVYYSERRETDPVVPTDIRKDGIIKDFETYWAFTNNPDLKLTKTNSTKWVWNAEITQYNRKGAELENRDPLGRYNAGIYGYQESLPVAVVNNSRLRLSAFDGFEDYYYQDDPCEPYCKPAKRHFTTGVTTSMLNDMESHTGKYSVKINTNTTYQVNVKVSADDEEPDPDIRIKLDKTPYQDVVRVNPQGNGLKGYFFNNSDFTEPANYTNDPLYPNLYMRERNNCFFNCDNRCSKYPNNLPSGINCYDMSARWKGWIQVITTGSYDFTAFYADDFAKIYVDITPGNPNDNPVLVCEGVNSSGNYNETRAPVILSAGILYEITVEYQQFGGRGNMNMGWRTPGNANFVPIPAMHLYPEGKESLANGSTVTETVYCIKPDTIQAINHHLIDSFNLVTNKRMVASVWMKKGNEDCKNNSYTNTFPIKNANGDIVASLTPKERIIEGWQQFEAVFYVPDNTDKLILDFQAASDAPIYIDDLRFHPFNANMKSFVYDPVTLRLAAELDENNYASFYEYDDDGGLVRVKKETREGIKTITETRSAVQKKITDLPD
jgi:hypothetical protein